MVCFVLGGVTYEESFHIYRLNKELQGNPKKIKKKLNKKVSIIICHKKLKVKLFQTIIFNNKYFKTKNSSKNSSKKSSKNSSKKLFKKSSKKEFSKKSFQGQSRVIIGGSGLHNSRSFLNEILHIDEKPKNAETV